MSYEPTEWKDLLVSNPDRYDVTDNGDGTMTIVPVWVNNEGEVIQKGTPVNAANLNKIEQGLKGIADDLDEHKAEIASEENLGHIKIGTGLTIEEDGTLSASHEIPYVTGTYTGDDVVQRVINLGFRPSAVLVFSRQGLVSQSQDAISGGLVVDSTGGNIAGPSLSRVSIDLIESGFRVYNYTTIPRVTANSSEDVLNPYRYIAFK